MHLEWLCVPLVFIQQKFVLSLPWESNHGMRAYPALKTSLYASGRSCLTTRYVLGGLWLLLIIVEKSALSLLLGCVRVYTCHAPINSRAHDPC
jgi:hypothetical protein